jgi:hypothetical protein
LKVISEPKLAEKLEENGVKTIKFFYPLYEMPI